MGMRRREVAVGAADGSHAAALAHAVEFGDGLVEALPKILRTSASGTRLQLVRRFGDAPGRGPFEPVSFCGLARRSARGGGGSEAVKSGTEASVWWGEDVFAKSRAPRFASLIECLFGVHRSDP